MCELSVDEIDVKENKDAIHLKELLSKAIEYSKTIEDGKIAIKLPGEGFTGNEALAIAIYCALKHQKDFSEALRAAVNHNGDSDSTGSITGAILGTLWGYEAIPEEWKDRLEPHDFIVKRISEYYNN
ncbi:MAG: ADP-ribosylglycohydrolase family protein [Bacteroidaceae bacterium]|nr:ADP-ribosylglycohydrolase family protein [Bacteroidaceae bacterium]